MRVTILGCGSSGGVPRVGNEWGACDPEEPHNRRSRCSLMVEEGGRTLLVDTSPDLRAQMLAVGATRVDAVLYTHDHADQTHGIDDLRAFFLKQRERIDIYGDPRTLEALAQRFSYIFRRPPGSGYPPICRAHAIAPDGEFRVAGVLVRSFVQHHGEIDSLGFRFGSIAYSSDVHAMPEASFAVLEGVQVWIVDALRYRPHPSHAHLERTLEWIARVRPRRAVLTNMHHDLDYGTLCKSLPEGIEPAYDGMIIEA